jgi:hypothetical protein
VVNLDEIEEVASDEIASVSNASVAKPKVELQYEDVLR